MSDLECKEIIDYDSLEGEYYGGIVKKYIEKYLFLEDNDEINSDLTKICNNIKNDISQLKKSIMKLESILFHTNHYSSELVNKAWIRSLSLTCNKYYEIKENNYMELFKFFLLMIHNSPYFLPNDDNVIPGCNRIFDLDQKSKHETFAKYYEYKVVSKTGYNYMRISDWLNTSNCKRFNCYCEQFF